MQENCGDELPPCLLLMLQDCRIRILDADKLQASRSLQVSELQQRPCILIAGLASCTPLTTHVPHHMQDNSSRFVSNMQQLQDSVTKYVAAIDQQVTCVGLYQLCTSPMQAACADLQQRTVCRWSGWKWRTSEQ